MNKEVKLLAKFGVGFIAILLWFVGGVISSSIGTQKARR